MVTRPRKLAENKMLWQIIIDRELQRAFRVECAKQGISMSKKASELVANYLAQLSHKKAITRHEARRAKP